jgi:hypothetical protein
MRHLSRASALTCAAVGLACPYATAGVWEDERPVVVDPVLQFRSYIAAAPDDVLYVLWPDWDNFDNTKVTLTRSVDKGQNWTTPEIIFFGTAYDNFQMIADDDGLHLILVEFMEEQEEFKWPYYTRSVDGGATFSEPVRVGEQDNVEGVRLFSDNAGTLYMYACTFDFTSYVYVSTDGGATWAEKLILGGAQVSNPDFAVADGTVHMVYGAVFGGAEIAHSTTDDDGDTWSTPVAVSQGAGSHSQLPSIALDGSAIHVAWEDDRIEHFEIFYSNSADGGATFGTDVQINDTPYGARCQLLADEEALHIVWCQYHGDNGWPGSWSSGDYGIIWYKSSDDAGATWSEEFRVSQNEEIPPIDLPDQGANYVKLAEYGNGFGAMWQDKRHGNFDLYLRNSFPPTCVWDCGDHDGTVATSDLLTLLGQWGDADTSCDLDGGGVGTSDLLKLLGNWGPCP